MKEAWNCCVDLHTHTLVTQHAYSTLGEYIAYAKTHGIAMFATTDHGPGIFDKVLPQHFGNLKVVPRLPEGVAVLRGIEANFFKDGSLGIESRYLKNLDIVLAGFHPNLEPSNADEHTGIVMQAIKSGLVDVITHPGNPKYPIDYEAVLECAKAYNVAVEINSSSSINTRYGSFDNCVKIAKLIKKIGNKVSLGTDAHIVYYMGNFEEAFKVMREAELDFSQVINQSPLKVLDFLESRGHPRIESIRDFFENRV